MKTAGVSLIPHKETVSVIKSNPALSGFISKEPVEHSATGIAIITIYTAAIKSQFENICEGAKL